MISEVRINVPAKTPRIGQLLSEYSSSLGDWLSSGCSDTSELMRLSDDFWNGHGLFDVSVIVVSNTSTQSGIVE